MALPTSSAKRRLKLDYARLKKDPVPYVFAEPNPSNILECYYVVNGPEDSPFAGGYYLGRLVFPMSYPFRPPTIYMITPNGRFKPNTPLCLSISDFLPELWNPAWSISTILTGLLSFMLENTSIEGSIKMTDYEKRQLAAQSLESNINDENFCELFPDLVITIKTEIEKRNLAQANKEQMPNTDIGQSKNNVLHLVVHNGVLTVIFALFIYLVKYVIYNMNIE